MVQLNYVERKALKDKKFQSTNIIWTQNKLNAVERVGCVSEIFKKFYNSKKSIFDTLTADDFLEYYFTIIKKKQIAAVSNELYEHCKAAQIEISKKECYLYCLIRVIDETFEGFSREIRAINYLKDLYEGADIVFADPKTDIDYCIDIEVRYDDVLLDTFQVKPITYIYGLYAKKKYCWREYYRNLKCHNKWYEEKGIKTVYLIEDENHTFLQKDYDRLL
jgi:hypothetical protein